MPPLSPVVTVVGTPFWSILHGLRWEPDDAPSLAIPCIPRSEPCLPLTTFLGPPQAKMTQLAQLQNDGQLLGQMQSFALKASKDRSAQSRPLPPACCGCATKVSIRLACARKAGGRQGREVGQNKKFPCGSGSLGQGACCCQPTIVLRQTPASPCVDAAWGLGSRWGFIGPVLVSTRSTW